MRSVGYWQLDIKDNSLAIDVYLAKGGWDLRKVSRSCELHEEDLAVADVHL